MLFLNKNKKPWKLKSSTRLFIGMKEEIAIIALLQKSVHVIVGL